jgi:hypothetical protein
MDQSNPSPSSEYQHKLTDPTWKDAKSYIKNRKDQFELENRTQAFTPISYQDAPTNH